MGRFSLVTLMMAVLVVNCSGTANAVPAVEPVAASAPDPEPMQVVPVSGISNPEMRSYRSVVAGLDAFDEHHKLAPGAKEVRFILMVKRDRAASSTDPLELKIVGAGPAITLALSEDGRFTVPRNTQAYEDDADLVLNRKKGDLQARPDVRSPGLPENVRRLGDLRLECQVTLAIAKKELPFLARAAATALMRTSDWCSAKEFNFRFTATELVKGSVLAKGAVLAFADRKLTLRTEGNTFFVPLSDPSWPDDALIELGTAP
jgi:hypothetical protein